MNADDFTLEISDLKYEKYLKRKMSPLWWTLCIYIYYIYTERICGLQNVRKDEIVCPVISLFECWCVLPSIQKHWLDAADNSQNRLYLL